MNLYPIKLTAYTNDYVFGGRLIHERLGKGNLPDGIVAETWEISDYQDKTGTVTNGELADRTLHELVEAHPMELVGFGWRGPHFPILQKFISASSRLPIHLHPDDETAQRLYKEPNGKTEAWHILWAAPNASILAGIIPSALSGVKILPTQQPKGAASLIACYVPDLERDIVMPLRKLGHSDEEIRALGEVGI